jgi:3',5'-cyclic AMP phosphodiesterase CpdA
MTSIIHISDPHAEGETMRRLNQLACSLPQCDVLALTGDCTSESTDQLPAHWDEWPQRLKLLVPGNHDYAHSFDLLHNWNHRAPWTSRLNDLSFIGIDSSNGFSDISLNCNS